MTHSVFHIVFSVGFVTLIIDNDTAVMKVRSENLAAYYSISNSFDESCYDG